MNSTFQIASVVAALGLGVAVGEYRSKPAAATTATPTSASTQEDEMTPEMMAEMEAWMRAGTPGEHHELLQPFVGTWDAAITIQMDADTTDTSTGTMTNEWILGGRFLQGTYAGSFMDQPFNGVSLWGYDNAAQTYRGVWLDSFSTHMQQSAGYVSEDGKVWTHKTTATNPMTGEPLPGKETLTLESEDRHVLKSWIEQDGELVPSMEIVYTRQQ